MFKVSSNFLAKIQQGKRKIFGRVRIYWTDPYFLKDSTSYSISSSYTLDGCIPQQILDDHNVADTRKWSHFDGVTSLADGIYFAPSNIKMAMAERAKIGWWGNVLSDTGGVFSPPMILTISHATPKTVFDVVVSGDSAYGEFPVDFKVRLYSDVDSFYVFDVKGNQLQTWRGIVPESTRALMGLETNFDFRYVTKMELEISKWSKAGRLAKITTFTAINEMIFEGKDIISMDIVEELEVAENDLPIGTASANEIDIQLNNIADRFYTGNPTTDLANVLLPNRKIRPELGVQISGQVFEWVPLGVYWSQGWNVVESSLEVSVTARDRMELLRQTRYLGSPVTDNKNLYALAKEVLESARTKLPDLDYVIDEELRRMVVPKCYLPVSDYMAALKTIAEASLGRVHADRKGAIQVSGPSRFYNMNPWDLGDYVWVFDDGEELVGETVFKSFKTAGWHSGKLYVTDSVTKQMSCKSFVMEVRDTDIDTPDRAVLSLPDGTVATTSSFAKVSSDPLKYTLMFDLPGAKAYKVTVYSASGKNYASKILMMEVRRLSHATLFALEGQSDATVTQKTPQQFALVWSSSGSKIVRAVMGAEERIFPVEVRPEIAASWIIKKV